jgi:hypothetical protein
MFAMGSLLLYFNGPQYAALSFAVGSLIVTGNFILLGSGWKLVFRKKLIALSVLIIVFKYAILGVIIYHFVKQSWLQPFWFAAGVASMMGASLIYALTQGFFEKEPEEQKE